MKRINSVIIPVVLILLLNSCAAVYQCGDPKPLKQPAMGKRLKAVVIERDKLCSDLASKQKENAGLKSNLTDETNKNKDLTAQFTDLQGRYKSLSTLSLSQTDKLSRDLAAKSEELNAKEKLLSDRERTLDEMKKIIARQDSLTNSLNNILRNRLFSGNSEQV